ncbi:MAG: AI-2E family transporter, partial [Saprospiraceae bacterium]|nr:AI-2E family transporter [Saprospiraceae bacterium]
MGIRPSFSRFQIAPNIIRQLLFISVLLILGIVILKELYFMVGAFLGAITLYVILMYPMKYLTIYKRWPAWIAALCLMLASLIVMVIPIIYLVSVAIEKLQPIIENPSIINEKFNDVHQFLFTNYNIDILKAENVSKISGQIVPMAQKTLGGTFSSLGNIFLMYLVLYFMLVQTRQLE